MDNSNIFKIWGERRRLLLTDKSEIDLLYLKKDCFCSTHRHDKKINRFVVVDGRVKIETEFGSKILYKNDTWEVNPKTIHRFIALKNSIMIELAYVNKGKINPKDIKRFYQGGKIINNEYISENELRKKGLLEL